MPPAIIAAGIGVAGSIAGGVAGGKGAKKAANIQAKSAADQLQLQRDTYAMNQSNFQPEIGAGNQAVSTINQLLFPQPGTPAHAAYTTQEVSRTPVGNGGNFGGGDYGQSRGPFGQMYAQSYGNRNNQTMTTVNHPATAAIPAQTPTDLIRSRPGYQFRYDEALKSLNANAYASGMAGSGATLKALQDRAYNVADSYYQTYLGDLSNVANRGMTSKSALAGVSQNYANASNAISQTGANAQSNYQQWKGNNLANMIQAVSQAGSSALGSSFGGAAKGGNIINDSALTAAGTRWLGS